MDRRVGNTEKLGALFGILAAIGHPLPTPGTLKYALAQAAQKVYGLASGARLHSHLSSIKRVPLVVLGCMVYAYQAVAPNQHLCKAERCL